MCARHRVQRPLGKILRSFAPNLGTSRNFVGSIIVQLLGHQSMHFCALLTLLASSKPWKDSLKSLVSCLSQSIIREISGTLSLVTNCQDLLRQWIECDNIAFYGWIVIIYNHIWRKDNVTNFHSACTLSTEPDLEKTQFNNHLHIFLVVQIKKGAINILDL